MAIETWVDRRTEVTVFADRTEAVRYLADCMNKGDTGISWTAENLMRNGITAWTCEGSSDRWQVELLEGEYREAATQRDYRLQDESPAVGDT